MKQKCEITAFQSRNCFRPATETNSKNVLNNNTEQENLLHRL